MKASYRQIYLDSRDITVCDLQINTLDPSFHSNDIKAKLTILRSALKLLPTNKTGHINAILTAPEYFFAKSVNKETRHYSEEEKNIILEGIKSLSSEFPGVLLIPGTIAWHQPSVDQEAAIDPSSNFASVPSRANQLSKEQYFALHARIGEEVSMEHYFKYAREFADTRATTASMIINAGLRRFTHHDTGMTTMSDNAIAEAYQRALSNPRDWHLAYNSSYFYLNGIQEHRYDKAAGFKEVSIAEPDIYVSFKPESTKRIDGVLFGIEVCFDHNQRILKEFYYQNSGSISADKTESPDIHLVLSAYVGNIDDNICVKVGGYFIHSSSEKSSRRYEQYIGKDEYTDIKEARSMTINQSIPSAALSSALNVTSSGSSSNSNANSALSSNVTYPGVSTAPKVKKADYEVKTRETHSHVVNIANDNTNRTQESGCRCQ